VSSIPDSIGYMYHMIIELTITWVPSGFSRYMKLDTKSVLKQAGMQFQAGGQACRKANRKAGRQAADGQAGRRAGRLGPNHSIRILSHV